MLTKLKQSDHRRSQQEDSSLTQVNKAFVQQQAFDLIGYFASLLSKVVEQCLKEVTEELGERTTYNSSFSRLYQHMKLALFIMQPGVFQSNKSFYEVLIQGSYQTFKLSGADDERQGFKTWNAVNMAKACTSFGPFWVTLTQKVKTHLVAKVLQLRQRQ